ncbi:hypothetical protein BASA60_001498 [Batrachochytrium salamandrivorans]|nr:hypothetical protein BASA60_001498 [Batrachochytrium salamandrivorans]
MKFNVLVVAAMAIASVNAVWYEGLPNGYDELPGEYEGPPSGYDELPSGAEHSGGRSTTELTQGSSGNGQGKVQVSEATEKDQICEGLKRILSDLWDRSVDLASEFHDQLPDYSSLMNGIGKNGERIKHRKLGPTQVAGYLALSGKEKAILTNFDDNYSGVVEDYSMTWGEFERNECSTESFSLSSPEDMIQEGHFLQLPDADGAWLTDFLQVAYPEVSIHIVAKKHADNLDRAVSDGRTDLVFAAARAMSGNSSRSVAVTPLYNSDGIVQYDPTSILRVMQGHYGSLAADTTGHSLDLQY